MLRRIIFSKTNRYSETLRCFASQQGGTPPVDPKEPIPIIDFDDPKDLPLPVYPDKLNEPLHQRKQRLLYQSRKRGMLENDLLLSTFADKHLKSWDAGKTALYDKLINGPTNDWDIYYWATNTKPTPPEYDNEIMGLLKMHVKNARKEQRLRQPDIGDPFPKE